MSRILYVEDDALLQVAGQMALVDAGYDVVSAMNGAEACEALRRPGAEFDALVTDINLPGRIDGWDVADLGRKFTAALPVIYVTAADGKDFASRGVPGGQLAPKPFEWRQVIGALSALMRRLEVQRHCETALPDTVNLDVVPSGLRITAQVDDAADVSRGPA